MEILFNTPSVDNVSNKYNERRKATETRKRNLL